jgi:hypothetical protein
MGLRSPSSGPLQRNSTSPLSTRAIRPHRHSRHNIRKGMCSALEDAWGCVAARSGRSPAARRKQSASCPSCQPRSPHTHGPLYVHHDCPKCQPKEGLRLHAHIRPRRAETTRGIRMGLAILARWHILLPRKALLNTNTALTSLRQAFRLARCNL